MLQAAAASCLAAWALAPAAANGQASVPIGVLRSAQVIPARFPITPAQIAGAMLRRQLPTKDARIVIAAPVTALSENAPLELQSMQMLSPHEIRLRLSCRNPAQCLSFFAVATYPEAIALAAADTNQAASASAEANSADLAAIPATATPAIETPRKQAARELTLRSGAPVTLQMDGDRIHIFLQVVSLEGGATGDKIRVATRDHKETYVAKIVTPTLVKGTL